MTVKGRVDTHDKDKDARDESGRGQGRLLATLERLLEIQATEVSSALDQATQLVAEALSADKVDAFLYDPAIDTLVAVGTSDTPMSRKQKALGLDRLPISNRGRTVEVFLTGAPYLTGHADQDPEELVGAVQGLGVRSSIAGPLLVAGDRQGVFLASSAEPDYFSDEDLRFLGAVAHWVGIVAHRAELVEQIAEAAAEQGRRATTEELITVLAHDLGNYLVPLKGRIDLIRRRADREGRSNDLQDATEALTAIERIRRLIADLLDVERLEQGIFAIAPQPVDLTRLAGEIAEALGTPATEIRLAAPQEAVVRADPDRLRQALENLVTNAIKHSPDGAPVLLEVGLEERADDRWAVIGVRDQGPGIAPDLLPNLFKRFAAGPGSSGLGLGLYLAHRIAAAHGGSLTVDPAYRDGARFVLALPAGGPPASPHPDPAPSGP